MQSDGYIYGYCHTNLDGYEMEIWPTVFAVVPKIGDRVRGSSGKELKVVGITHTIREQRHSSAKVPEIMVELNRTQMI